MLSNQNAFSPINCGCCTYSHLTSECCLLETGLLTFTHSHTHEYTDGKSPWCQPAHQERFWVQSLAHGHLDMQLRESGIQPETFQLMDDPFCPLNRSQRLFSEWDHFLNGEYLTFSRLKRLMCLNKVTRHSCNDYIGFWNLDKKLCLPALSYVTLCDP